MAQQPFIYNPSQSIKESASAISEGVQNIWKPIIQKKVNDYNSIKSELDNIDKVKADLSMYHRDMLGKKANEIQTKYADIIKKNGKVDYKQKALIDDEVRQLRQLNQNSKDAGTVYQEMLELGKNNANYVNDMAGFKDSIARIVRDPQYLMSGSDMRSEMMKAYSKQLNMPLLITERAKKLLPEKAVATNEVFIDKDGNRIQSEMKQSDFYTLDKNTGKVVVNKDKVSELFKSLPVSDMEKQALTENYIGAGKAFGANADDAIQKIIEDTLLANSGFKINKFESAADVEKEKLGLSIAKQDLKSKEWENTTGLKLKEANIKSQISSRETGNQIAAGQLGVSQGSLALRQQQYNDEKQGIGSNVTGGIAVTPGSGRLELPFKFKDTEYVKIVKNKAGQYVATNSYGGTEIIKNNEIVSLRNSLEDNKKKAWDVAFNPSKKSTKSDKTMKNTYGL